MSFVRRSFPSTIPRQHPHPVSLGRQLPRSSNRRGFATERPSGQRSNARWILLSLGLGIPISYYLWQRGAIRKPRMHPLKAPRGANQEYEQSAEGNEKDENGYEIGERTSRVGSAHDEPRGMGAPGPVGSMSSKQEGLDNGDSMNPFINEPGLSKKGEGETDSIKVKGTVNVHRPQV